MFDYRSIDDMATQLWVPLDRFRHEVDDLDLPSGKIFYLYFPARHPSRGLNECILELSLAGGRLPQVFGNLLMLKTDVHDKWHRATRLAPSDPVRLPVS